MSGVRRAEFKAPLLTHFDQSPLPPAYMNRVCAFHLPPDPQNWGQTLSTFEIDLKREGIVANRGRATNVLGGPVSALRHLVNTLTRDQINPALAAGEIVTTGTLTRALPASAHRTEVHRPNARG